MGKLRIRQLACGADVDVYYLAGKRDGQHGVRPLNTVRQFPTRMPRDGSSFKAYQAMAGFYAVRLVEEVKNANLDFDAIVVAPSSQDDAEPYSRAFFEHFPNAIFIDQFTKSANARDPEVTAKEVQDGMCHTSGLSVEGVEKLLIIDDVLAEGKTVSAVIAILREHQLNEDAIITVAVPLCTYEGT